LEKLMAILDILHFPDPRLRNQAKPVSAVNDAVRRLVDDMFETMYQAPGIGLAATQVNVAKQVVVIDLAEERDQPLCLINPEILEKDGEEQMDLDGVGTRTTQLNHHLRMRRFGEMSWLGETTLAQAHLSQVWKRMIRVKEDHRSFNLG